VVLVGCRNIPGGSPATAHNITGQVSMTPV